MPEIQPPPTLPEPANLSGCDPEQVVYNMVWPANRLTYRQMSKLRYVSKLVKVPMNQLIKDAVDVYLAGIQRHLRELIDVEILPAEASESESLANFSVCLVAETPSSLPHSNQSPTAQKLERATAVREVAVHHE